MRPKIVRDRERFHTLPAFNNREPLTVVVLADGTLGVVDATTLGVWVGYDAAATPCPWRSLKRVDLPEIPEHNGVWVTKWIGGIGRTVRREGCLRAKSGMKDPITLFATQMPASETACECLRGIDGVTVGDTEAVDDPLYGRVAEVVVHDPTDVDLVAARLARAGVGRTIFERHDLNAHRHRLGVERLDRIESSISKTDADDERTDPEEFGQGRGDENWKFSWMPSHWKYAPVTWDFMVRNVDDVEDVSTLPMPLRRHVARYRHGMLDASTDEAKALARHVWDRNGRERVRDVSAGLTIAQSKQLINAFYACCVERVEDPTISEAASLVLYHYMFRQGYTARYMGKYLQNAKCIGNGDRVRVFRRLSQYDPHRLPTSVLNRLVQKDGKIRSRGSKGSRSKYVDKDHRYIPKRRASRAAREVTPE